MKPSTKKPHPALSEPQPFGKAAEAVIAEFRGLPLRVPRRQVKRATKPVAELVEQILQKYKIGRDSPEQTIRERWAELVGTANASYSHPVEIEPRSGRLLVLASHAVVRSELFHHRARIVEKIRALPGCSGVRHLNIKAG